MHPLVTKMMNLAKKSWKYDLTFVVGAGIGAAGGWIFCKKKLQDEYTKAVDKQVEAYKKKVRAKTHEILAPIIPKENEELTPEQAKERVAGGNFQTSSIEDFKPTPESEQTAYNKMYKPKRVKNPYNVDDVMDTGNVFGTPEELATEMVKKMSEEEWIQVVDAKESQKLNDIPRTATGAIKRGARPATMDEFEDAPEEDRVSLVWYEEDDILADPDGDIWDEDDAFGDDLAEWKADKDVEDIVRFSNLYPDKIFLIEKKHCSYTEIFDTDLDAYLYED